MHDWQPTNGKQDDKPFTKCSECGHFALCYRAQLLSVVDMGTLGQFERFRWLCTTCTAHLVAEALAQAEET